MKELTARALAALEKHGFTVHAFASGGEMRDFVLAAIPAGASVGCGGSVTVRSLGLYDALREKGCAVYDHAAGDTPQARDELMKNAHGADCYLTGTNAVTAGGRLYNVDGNGNRVAAMIYGPRIVYILVGENKFVETDEDAVERVRAEAGPKNAARLHKKTPCAATGRCMDCASPDRICNVAVWLDRVQKGRTIHVCVCPETLGL